MNAGPPKGLIVPLVTPFNPKRQIDWGSLQNLIERVLPHCNGLFIGEGWVGEGLSLPNHMRCDLLAGAHELVGGKKPLFLSPTADTPEETLKNLIRLEEKISKRPGEAPVFWVDLPLWYHSNRKLPALYREWERQTRFPVILQNHPGLITQLGHPLKRKNLRTLLLKTLVENERIVGLIQVGDIRRSMNYQRAVRSRRDFRFYDGDEMGFLNSPASSGVVARGANLFPKEWSEIVSSSLTLPEDPEANFPLFQKSQIVREFSRIIQGPSATPIKNLKTALFHLGVISHPGMFKSPSDRVPPEVDSKMKDFLRKLFPLQIPQE